jgi:glycosyltransferase involved in cell wall biosynthesis
MKILLISGIYGSEIGGPAFYTQNLARSLINSGHSVTIVTLKHSKEHPQYVDWPVFYVDRNQQLLFRFIKVFKLIYRLGKTSDFIFANGLYHECGLALRMMKTKSIAKVVGDPVYEREANQGRTTLTRSDFLVSNLNPRQICLRKFLTFCLNSFTNITCPSQELVLMCKKWGIVKPVHLIPNGVGQVEIVETTKVYDLVTVSRLVAIKNIDVLIRACVDTKAKIAVVGSGPEEKSLRDLANFLGTQVKFFGQLKNYEVIDVLSKSKIFVQLSDYEGLSFALLQAMSVGIPSIVSHAKGNIDVIENYKDGIIVNPQKLNEVSEVIRELISNEELQSNLGKTARDKVSRLFSHNKHMNEIHKLIELSLACEK